MSPELWKFQVLQGRDPRLALETRLARTIARQLAGGGRRDRRVPLPSSCAVDLTYDTGRNGQMEPENHLQWFLPPGRQWSPDRTAHSQGSVATGPSRGTRQP